MIRSCHDLRAACDVAHSLQLPACGACAYWAGVQEASTSMLLPDACTHEQLRPPACAAQAGQRLKTADCAWLCAAPVRLLTTHQHSGHYQRPKQLQGRQANTHSQANCATLHGLHARASGMHAVCIVTQARDAPQCTAAALTQSYSR